MGVFKDKKTRELWLGKTIQKWKHIKSTAQRRLKAVLLAHNLQDLANVPGNRLEKLVGDKYSIRINQQYRVVFQWDKTKNQAYNLEINDHNKRYGK